MRIAILLPLLLPLLGTGRCADIKTLILPGDAFGAGWELTQSNIIGSTASPNYINRALSDSPIVMIQVISLSSEKEARERLENKMQSPQYKEHAKKLSDEPMSYEQVSANHKRRYVVIKNYWLTVDQTGDRDDRSAFIEKYTEIIKNKG
jgi:hypothetical protein